jgi:lipoprotein-anchoring transpeptidase ErfK/SrfK
MLIIVSISQQKLTAYDHGKAVFTSLVTTGMPALYTPEGTYHILSRAANTMFYSPWPKGSPYYYAPLHINYALQMTASGIYLHDATWRSVFGPGTNVPHKDPVYGEETGSHGCVELPVTAMKWLYNWAHLGMSVEVVN